MEQKIDFESSERFAEECLSDTFEEKEDYDGFIDPYRQYVKEVMTYPVLSEEEEKETINLLKEGSDAARNKLVNHNLRLVISVANRYLGYGVSKLDLIQEGNMGLIKAVDRFNPSIGCRFSTYAVHWIRQAVTRYIANTSRTIRIPVHLSEKYRKYIKEAGEFFAVHNREPSEEEMAELIGMSAKKLSELKMAFYLADPYSLDALATSRFDDEYSLGELIPDLGPGPEEIAMNNERNRLLYDAMDSLSERDMQILKNRFDLDGEKRLTLEDLGRKYNISRERVRQIERDSLILLGNIKNRKKLEGYTNV